tara:strand:+ start:167 stop:484 length:318 start_codon:yes stop_codon:yes gene_type:complete
MATCNNKKIPTSTATSTFRDRIWKENLTYAMGWELGIFDIKSAIRLYNEKNFTESYKHYKEGIESLLDSGTKLDCVFTPDEKKNFKYQLNQYIDRFQELKVYLKK